MTHRDLAFGGAGIAISILYYWMATLVPVSQLADAIGPQGLPKVYAVILAALSLMLMIRSVRDRASRKRKQESSTMVADSRSRSFRAAGMLLIGIGYILLAPWFGYLLSISGLIFATSYYQGGIVDRQAALVALCGGMFFWVLFVAFMGIAQPPGLFPLQP